MTGTASFTLELDGTTHCFDTFEAMEAFRDRVCTRCHAIAPDPGADWTEDWPNYGRIDLGYAAQIFAALRGHSYASDEDFAFWRTVKEHPAVIDEGAQGVTFEWGRGFRYDSRRRGYRLCRLCQGALLKVVGAFFFGAPQ